MTDADTKSADFPDYELARQRAVEIGSAKDLADLLERKFQEKGFKARHDLGRSMTIGAVHDGMMFFWKKHPEVFLRLRMVKKTLRILFHPFR